MLPAPTVLCAMLNLLAMMVIAPSADCYCLACFGARKSFANANISTSLSSLGLVGVPFGQRHPQAPSFTQTSMPKYDLFPEPLLLIVTFQEINRILSKVQKSFWSCTHVNSCQKYTLYINRHILLNN